MDNTETQETYSQTRENRRGNQGWTIQRHKKHTVKPEKTKGAIKDGQYRDTRNIVKPEKTEGAIKDGQYRDTRYIQSNLY